MSVCWFILYLNIKIINAPRIIQGEIIYKIILFSVLLCLKCFFAVSLECEKNFMQKLIEVGEFDINSLSFVIDGDWGCPERELVSFVHELSERLGEDALIIADNSCLSVDPYTFFAYSFGDGVSTELFAIDDEEEYDADEDGSWGNGTMWGMQDNTDINNIADTISYGNCFCFSEKELEVLKSFGIE